MGWASLRGVVVAIVASMAFGLGAPAALAQPTDVRAWSTNGQVFVVWRMLAPPASPTSTIEIYTSTTPQASIATMQRVGRLFPQEYTASRLRALQANARAQVPRAGGGSYRLAADEGVFVLTPRSGGSRFFAVVASGSTVVAANNSATVAVTYDPVNDPVVPHLQFSGTTTQGNPYDAYLLWVDGSDNPSTPRPDMPVLADADKNGVPHAFTITWPQNPLPLGPAGLVLALHGGEGEYQLFRPGMPARGNLALGTTDAVVLTPDDSYFMNNQGTLERINTSWFGYASEVDPFIATPRLSPPDGSIVRGYTARRVHWIMDWIQSPRSPVAIDPQRVAGIGHSGGGRGISLISRLRPERFSAIIVHTPASDQSIDPGVDHPFRGSWDQDLDTDVLGPNGVVGVTDLFNLNTRLSPTFRDFPLTRFTFGKRDTKDQASWSPGQRAVLDQLNASRWGAIIFWDEREHGVEMWDDETDDASDGFAGPWPDIAQWIAPVRTEKHAAAYLLRTSNASQSYPGIFNADADPLTPGLQPDPGPGDPNLGDPFGTWGGYVDWDRATIVDLPRRWEATLFLTGRSLTSIDNAPFASITTDLIPRKTSAFAPPAGLLFNWSATHPTTGILLQSGQAVSESDGVVAVLGLVVPRDPDRVRLVIELNCPCPADYDNSGSPIPDIDDLLAFFADFAEGDGTTLDGDPSADVDCTAEGSIPDIDDILRFFEVFASGC